MNKKLSFILLLLAVAAFAACGGEPAAEHDDGHDAHDEQEGHEDCEDHAAHGEDGDEHGDHGERIEIGEAQAGPHSVHVAVFGDIEAGHEAVLDIEVSGAGVAAVRAWVGNESGRGSMKSKVDGEDGIYHGHVEVPATLADASAIWIEVEASNGTRSKTSFDMP